MSEAGRVRATRWQGVPRGSRLSRAADAACGLVGLILVVAVATIPLQPREQAILAVILFVVFLVANRFSGRGVSVFLVILSLATSLRYIYWRTTETLDFGSAVEYLLGFGLLLAEFYAIVVLVLGYIQTLWPLERKPIPLPDDVDSWPSVDVYIPTYDEKLSIVRATVLGAIGIDWPADKLRVYLLDDGRRPEFQQFAADCGIGYIARASNAHAKAGNLNHAMQQTDGELIAVFDCDHVPTRAFLQMTVGWMMAEARLAMVQTPHHFYSPDPFQRNLRAGTRVPSEGNMFYGLVQDANDFWNATFFCGSCAVIRRAALDEIGGFATETVTEDAHTMLKLHRRGWDSAYLRLPLAAGLATERLILHIGQRTRWARGMIQIFRIDNPLFGPGLTFGQRVCYLQSLIHFLFAVPRLVFLTAPLAFLLLGLNVVAASPMAIVAYALPHIFHSVATNSRLQRQNRHSFWSEIYETVLALFLVRVSLVTLFAPKRGTFNVTNKGGLLENGYFDLGAVYPNLILAVFLLLAVVSGFVRMAFFQSDVLTAQALLLNTIWGCISLLTVMAALAVGRETRQIRSRARVRATVPLSIYLPDGRAVSGITRDLSQGGSSIVAARPPGVTDGALVQFEFLIGGEPVVIPAQLIRWVDRSLQVRWLPASLSDEAAVVSVVFGRADAWTDWAAYAVDRPLVSLYRVLVSIRGLFRARDKDAPSGGAGLSGPRQGQFAGTAAALLLLLLPIGVRTQPSPNGTGMTGSSTGFVVRPVPGPVQSLRASTLDRPAPAAAARLPGLPGLLGVPSGSVAPQATPFPPGWQAMSQPGGSADTTPPPMPSPPPSSLVEPASAVPRPALSPAFSPAFSPGVAPGRTRRLVLTLHELGAVGPLTLRGTSELQGVQFGVRADEIVTGAVLNLSGAMSPALIPQFSNVTVTLNEQYVGTIPVVRDHPKYDNLEMAVSPVYFQDNNRLNFRFTGRYTPECNDPLSGLLWASISDTATLTLTLQRLPPQRDLARLPLPFFDSHEKLMLRLPMVLPANPSDEALAASGIVASWFGAQADFRGATFPVLGAAPSEGNAVVVVAGDSPPDGLSLPAITGPTLAVIPNPADPGSSLLLVGGRTGAEAIAAATSLSLGSRTLTGSVAALANPVAAPVRAPYDAPGWLAADRPVKFGELVDAADLQGTGYVPGTMRVPFRTAPDLYTWRDRPFPMDVRYRAPPGPIEDLAVSRLDVGINDNFLATLPLAVDPARNTSWVSRLLNAGAPLPASRIEVPAYQVVGQNDLQFFFDARPLNRGNCVAVPQDVHMAVDPDSTIDISRAYRFAEMPNLAYFISSGFPFTRMADLSETAVVMPDQPQPAETGAFLDLMGRLGSLTAYPVTKLMVVRPGEAASVAHRDLLLLGAVPALGGAGSLLRNTPFRVDGGTLTIALSPGLASVRRLFGDQPSAERDDATAALAAAAGAGPGAASGAAPAAGFGVLVSGQSPLDSGRTVLAVLGRSADAVASTVAMMRDPEQAPLIQGDMALANGGRVTAYRVGPRYTVGSLPFWLYPAWLLRGEPLGIVGVLLVGCALVAVSYFYALRRHAAARAGGRAPGQRPD